MRDSMESGIEEIEKEEIVNGSDVKRLKNKNLF